MGDPLFAHGVGLAVVIIAIIKVVAVFALLMVSVMLMIWLERKVISDMQNRIGPNRAGPFGILQSLADGIKLFFKEDLLPNKADRFVFRLAPYLTLLPAFLIFTIVPIGGAVDIAHHAFDLQVADPPMGILFLLALSSVSVYGTMLAGWSSGSKYPLLGSVRASAQMISYEAAMGLAVAAVVLEDHTLSTRAIVMAQSPSVLHWGVFQTGIVPFLIFWIAATAELNRPPFDLVEGEQELVGGFHTEYSSIRFGMFYLAEFMNTITMSAVVVTLFFGGPDGPIPHGIPGATVFMPVIWFLLKTAAFCFVYVWFRAALPRLRYDQLMDLGWKRLIPLTLAWLLLVASVITWHWGGLIMVVVVLAAAVLLTRATRLGDGRSETEAVIPPVGQRLAPAPRLTPVPELTPVPDPGGPSDREGA